MYFFHHYDSEKGESEYFNISIDKILEIINHFEVESNKSPSCGGISGGEGVSVSMKINSKTTNFGFCKQNFNGLDYLLTSIKNLKVSDYNSNYFQNP